MTERPFLTEPEYLELVKKAKFPLSAESRVAQATAPDGTVYKWSVPADALSDEAWTEESRRWAEWIMRPGL